MTSTPDSVALKIGWARLLGMVDEAAAAIKRSAFSPLVREMNDFALGIFDARGRLLATSALGSPGLTGMLPGGVRHFVEAFPEETLKPGDVLVTNDPWLVTGHLHDITVAQPVFHGSRIVAWAASSVHVEDIGGRGPTIDARDNYEEGLFIPPCRLVEQGRTNELLVDILRNAVRTPDSVLGDVRSQLAAMHVLACRIPEMLDEFGWPDLCRLADGVIDRTGSATRAAIAKIRAGSYTHAVVIDGYRASAPPIRLVVTVTVGDGRISLDFKGTSPQVPWGINAPMNVVTGYGFFPLKCILDPGTPLNEGLIGAIDVSAPPGCILNADRRMPVWGRLLVGFFLSELVFGALAKAIPERVVASSGGVPQWTNFFDGISPRGRRFVAAIAPQGGLGGRASGDGLSTLGWPANLSANPVEMLEHETGLLCERMELTTDSAGAGRHRGGLGQTVVLSVPDAPRGPRGGVRVSLRGGRLHYPAAGLLGGMSPPLGRISINDELFYYPSVEALGPGDRITCAIPGGGGFGDPLERDPEDVARDVREQYVSRAAAESDYGVRIAPDGTVDTGSTAALRATRAGAAGKVPAPPADNVTESEEHLRA
jgi:N-methylhydantoinase B/oxoprolinase/acetone carboxylase alpha subunit